MIRHPLFQLITQKYEVFESDDPKEAPVGKASVVNGLIESLMIQQDAGEDFYGEIFNKLLRAIIEDADHHNSNLSIRVAEAGAVRLKRFLERYGFRETHEGIYKRNSGSSVPPSVLY
jgi:hypothetical protein